MNSSTDHQMNQAELLEHFLVTTNEGTDISKSFLPLVRRIWRHKDGMKIFAMVDDSYILWVNDKTRTFITTDDMAEAMLQDDTKNLKNPKAKASTMEYLRGEPTEHDIQYEDSAAAEVRVAEVVMALLGKDYFNE